MTSETRFLNDPSDVQEVALATVAKAPVAGFSSRAFHALLVAEHSPIRCLILRWKVKEMPERAVQHLVRHVHAVPYVSTSRPDRVGPEGETEPAVRDVIFDLNCQSVIDIARKRLCFRAWSETRDAVVALKLGLMRSEDPFKQALADVMAPNCVYRNGCPEGKGNCGWWLGHPEMQKGCVEGRMTVYGLWLAETESLGVGCKDAASDQ